MIYKVVDAGHLIRYVEADEVTYADGRVFFSRGANKIFVAMYDAPMYIEELKARPVGEIVVGEKNK